MSLLIGENEMTCELSRHYAERVEGDRWRLSWLPDRDCDRNQAISALTAAEELAGGSPREGLVRTLLVVELGLSEDEWPEEVNGS